MHYYPYFQYTGTYVLANALGATDPFALDPAEIVERVLSAGYTRVSDPRSEPLELSRLPYRMSMKVRRSSYTCRGAWKRSR